MGNTLTDIVGKLESMGSADQIALELEGLGIRATRRDPESCAITEYVNQQDHEYLVVSTSGRRIAGCNAERGEWSTVDLPVNVSTFVQRFDNGDFPNLVAADPADGAA